MAPKYTGPPQESSRSKQKRETASPGNTGKKKAEVKPPPKPQRATLSKSLAMRTEPAVDSDKAGDLPAGTAIYVLKVEELPSGMKRAQVAMAENSPPLGWVTESKDGVMNLAYDPAPSARSEKTAGKDAKATAPSASKEKSFVKKGASMEVIKEAAADSELMVFLLARAGISHAEAVEAAAASTKAKAKAAAAAAEAASKPPVAEPIKKSRTGHFMAKTASSQAGGTAAARRNKKFDKARAADTENTAVSENVEDFDWASAGGGWTVEKWLSSLQVRASPQISPHLTISSHVSSYLLPFAF